MLNKVKDKIPRTFVNLIPMFNIGQVYDWAQTDGYCRFMWNTLMSSECMCLQGKATDEDRRIMDEYAAEYRMRVARLTERWGKKGLNEFKVVMQPAIANRTSCFLGVDDD